MFKKISIPIYVVLISVFNISCGGGGGSQATASGDDNPTITNGDDNPTTTLETGVLFDDPVSGVNYQTATQSGVTDAQGNYSYLPGETVSFSIGDIIFPSTDAAPIVTPLDMVGVTDLTDTSVINILRLLQSLDVDGDPTNGIEISSAAHTAATGLTIAFDSSTFDSDVTNLVADSGSVTTALIDGGTAVNNFEQSLSTQTIDWESYYYFANNRQWNYIITEGNQKVDTVFEYITNGTVNGQNVYIHGWTPSWSNFLEYLQNISNEILFTGFQSEEGVDTFFTTPIMLGCNNLYESCDIAGTEGGMDFDFTFINELGVITVPAGTYTDCIKTTQTDKIGKENRIIWRCRDTGQVRHEKIDEFAYELDSITTYAP